MIWNYITISFRKFRRQKLCSLLNILGLASGMATVILILLYVMDDLSYDRFHRNEKDLYRVVENQYYPGSAGLPGGSYTRAAGRSGEDGIRGGGKGNKQYVRVFSMVAAFIISVPLAWLWMLQWLSTFAYHIRLSWLFFIVSGLVAVIISLITVSYQSGKVGWINPARVLRSESFQFIISNNF